MVLRLALDSTLLPYRHTPSITVGSKNILNVRLNPEVHRVLWAHCVDLWSILSHPVYCVQLKNLLRNQILGF